MNDTIRTPDLAQFAALQAENAHLRTKLEEAEETLRAIREGEVDAIVVSGSQGDQLFSLSGAESVYRRIVETMQEAALTVAPDGTILSGNPQVETLLHCPAGSIIGRPLEAFVVPEARATLPDLLARCQEAPARQRLVFRTADDVPVPAHVSAQALQQPEGPRLCLVATDLTALETSLETLRQVREQQEALRASEAEFRAVFDTAAVGIAEVGLDGRYVRMNDRYCALTGFARAELLGMTPVDLTPPDERTTEEARLVGYLQELPTVFEMEKRYRRKDGQVICVRVTTAPIRDAAGRVLRSVGIVQDITARMQAEAALRESYATLEQRVIARTADLSRALEQLHSLAAEITLVEQRERVRLASVLHDGLQQLLVAARLRVTLLGRSTDPVVRQHSQEIGQLLEEAIADSHSLTAELSPPVLRTGGLLAGLKWLARWCQDTHHLSVALAAPEAPLPPVPVHLAILLFQGVREILFNTVKYAQVSAATVTLAWDESALTLTVADAGVGFDPTLLRGEGGTGGGFGLATIRHRLELLGGCMQIVSAPGQGTRVTLAVVLPSAAPPAGFPAPPPAPATDPP